MKFFSGHTKSSNKHPQLSSEQYAISGGVCTLETTNIGLVKKVLEQLKWLNEDLATFPEYQDAGERGLILFRAKTALNNGKFTMTIEGDMNRLLQFFQSYEKLSRSGHSQQHNEMHTVSEAQRLLAK